MRCGVIGDNCVTRVAKSGLLFGNGERCGRVTCLEQSRASKAGRHRIGAGDLIEREIARRRAGGVGDACAALCAEGKCDRLASHARGSSTKGEYSGKSDKVVVVACSSASVGDCGGGRGYHKGLKEISDVG